MSIMKIRTALEVALLAIAPSIDTVMPNTSYNPQADTPYQKIDWLSARPVNPTMGGKYRREIGLLQVTLRYPQRNGAGDAEARAQLLQDTFQRGNSYSYGGVTVIIDRSPEIASAMDDDDRYCIPVRISYFAEIYS